MSTVTDTLSPQWVKYEVATGAVLEVSSIRWRAADTDGHIYYLSAKQGTHTWYACSGLTLICREVPVEQVPAQVRLAVELVE